MADRSSSSEQSPSLCHSPVTSVATSPGSPDPTAPYQSPLGLSPEAVEIVSNLSNYLALGCLSFENLSNAEVAHDSAWQDVTTLPILPFDTAVATQLAQLLRHGWIRLQSSPSQFNPQWLIFRIYLLYKDIGQSYIDRKSRRLLLAVECLLGEIDISPETWNGRLTPGSEQKFDLWATRDEDDSSLFYVFNGLPSPSPVAADIDERYKRESLEDLLDPSANLPGLKTVLYPYQRRSAGAMLHRESASKFELSPQLERRKSPDGSFFYYSPRDLEFARDPEYYETTRGGILAETMGLGKTVICLSLILATKNHPPLIPIQYSQPAVRTSVASLAEMAVSTINRKSIPWQVEFERIRAATGDDMNNCAQRLHQNPPDYHIPIVPFRWNRNTTQPSPQRMTLASTTLIVVPQNLCRQWQTEIAKHIEAGFLSVLIMDDRRKALPPPDVLRTYDIILFTRNRFDKESKDGEDNEGRRMPKMATICRCPYIGASRRRDCRCLKEEMLYDSPLKYLHFKRLIVDEGHFFSNSNTNTVAVANKLVTADHRWSVSGTPAKDLLGVEVDMSALSDAHYCREVLLEQRRRFSIKEDKTGAIESLGSLASNFLKIEPWSSGRWKDYIYRHEDPRRYTFSGFSTCLRRTLASMVVKTRPSDVEKDIELPPLHHKIVRLEPSFYDKLSANLFTLVLTANSITSERADTDYLFHKNSRKARYQLVSNLRQSAFFWTGFSESDVHASIKNSIGYLTKDETGCTPTDRQLMLDTLACTDSILESEGWKSMSRSHELGIFVESWPEESAEYWSFDKSRTPLLTGISQLLEAQNFVNRRVLEADPGEGLSGAGIKALSVAQTGDLKNEDVDEKGNATGIESKMPVMVKSGIPASSIDGEPILRRRSSSSNVGISPRRNGANSFRITKARDGKHSKRQSTNAKAETTQKDPTRLKTKGPLSDRTPELPPNSPYAKARVVGTTSAKMSYLLSQILKHHKQEKILVFYQGDNIAFYIAQALELLDIKHEIYAKSLQSRLKSEYVVTFDQGDQHRVLLMDVGQAAFGLNLSSASRIYFVNPVCRPNVEAQAIKRAHRIGQTREVFVETLVLKDTVEEKMLERSARMTTEEHREASNLEDDGGIREIIQSSRIVPIAEHEKHGRGQMAAMESPEQLWCRSTWHGFHVANAKRRRPAVIENINDHGEEKSMVQEHEATEGLSKRRRTDADEQQSRRENNEWPLTAHWAESFRPSIRDGQHGLTLPPMESEELSAASF